MNKVHLFLTHISLISILIICISSDSPAQSNLNCSQCHPQQKTDWFSSKHANTQTDIAGELAANWKGQTADSVILGSAPENCVYCHAPTAVTAGGGMTEVQVMSHFFSTTNGKYTDNTSPLDTTNWPHVACVACHNVQTDHPVSKPALSLFSSTKSKYDLVQNSSNLCGHCHGTIQFTDTDHRIYDAWQLSKHGHGNQNDIVSELAGSWADKTPDDVINGPEAENCIACHAPTAVKMNGGVSEVEVLKQFFTMTGGKFTNTTTVADTTHWSELACTGCHNPHNPGTLSYYNSTTREYQIMSSSNQLCGQCHGDLRFPNTDHLTYNIESGTGGIGVPDQLTMKATKCVDCHMHKGDTDGTNSLMYKGHRWSVFIDEPDGSTSAACTTCHKTMSVDEAIKQVGDWKGEYARLDSIANIQVALAEGILHGSTDTLKLHKLSDAKFNLGYAESDESKGFHNHKYLVALLNAVITQASRLTSIQENGLTIPTKNELTQNYPNPVLIGLLTDPTMIQFSIPQNQYVRIVVYDACGKETETLVDDNYQAGTFKISWPTSKTENTMLNSGIYFYRMSTLNFSSTKKMLLIR